MKNIIAATALSLMMGTAAFAQTTAQTTPFATYKTDVANDIYASELIGMRIYSAEKDYDTFTLDSTVAAGAEREWDDIGEVDDVVLSRDGSVRAVIVGVGGFLGIGEKDVALPMDAIKMVREADADDADDFFLVVNAPKEALTNAEEYVSAEDMLEKDRMNAAKTGVTKTMTDAKTTMGTKASDAKVVVENSADNAAVAVKDTANDAGVAVKDTANDAAVAVKDGTNKAADAVKTTAAAGAAAVTTAASDAANAAKDTMNKADGAMTTKKVVPVTEGNVRMDGDRTMLRTPMFEREGYTVLPTDELNTEDLTGARVYSLNDDDIGEVSELILDDSGKITKAILDIGGFLGMGEHSVALTMDEMKLVRTGDADDVRVYVDATKEELEAQPEYTR